MALSKAFYTWLNITTAAESAAELKRMLAGALEELTMTEYDSLMKVLRMNLATKKLLDELEQPTGREAK